jgi:hypothetical protein
MQLIFLIPDMSHMQINFTGQAGADLVRTGGHLAGVVGPYAHDLAVFDKKAQRATSAAIHIAGGPDHPVEVLDCTHIY